jgi:hypothetical protein
MTSKIVVNNIEADLGSTTVNVSSGLSVAGGISVGSNFIGNNAVGLGATTTTGRNAGVGTAVGTIIYNSTENAVQVYTGNGWTDVRDTGIGIKATGGSITQVADKTIHTFTGSGTFRVTNPTLTSVDYLMVGGGGGGGSGNGGGGGGGGAGLFLSETGIPVNTTPFAVTIGAGGVGSSAPATPNISQRGNSTTVAFPSGTKTATYGGGGASTQSGGGDPGGSGGGAGNATPTSSGGPATGSPYPGTPGTTPSSGWGHAGGSSGPATPQAGAGGGGGAGGVGGNGSPTATGNGGAGVQLPSTFRGGSFIGSPGPGGGNYWVAGGGGGGAGFNGGPGTGPIGVGGGPGGPYAGAGNGGPPGPGKNALANTGSGGGGFNSISTSGIAGSGGSGIVIIAYPS